MIRKITLSDKKNYLEMAAEFYSSEAVMQAVPQKHFLITFDELMRSDDYVKGYFFEDNKIVMGYTLLAKSFSQEAGGFVLWIDELYVKPEFRCRGIGHNFFKFIKNNVKDIKRIRLEVEKNNTRAVSLYKKMGFTFLEYGQMIEDL